MARDQARAGEARRPGRRAEALRDLLELERPHHPVAVEVEALAVGRVSDVRAVRALDLDPIGPVDDAVLVEVGVAGVAEAVAVAVALRGVGERRAVVRSVSHPVGIGIEGAGRSRREQAQRREREGAPHRPPHTPIAQRSRQARIPPRRRVAGSGPAWRNYRGESRIATMRSGPPLPPPIFIGSATT